MTDDNKESKLLGLINSLDVNPTLKQEMLLELKALTQKVILNNKLTNSLIVNKETINNLNHAIKSLEEKNKAIISQVNQLEKQARIKEELFAHVSHEMRTPTHGILGISHLLEKTTLNTIQKEYIEIVKSSAENLLVIVNDILGLSQINAAKLTVLKEAFNILQFLAEMEGMLNIRAKKKGLQLSFLTPPNVPEYLIGDQTRLFQVILNLLNNSLKFTHQGYILMTTQVAMVAGDQIELQLEIKDTGIGMEREKLSTIFDSFTRVHDDNGVVYEGVGLGLNIVKNLLNLMNGTIKVESELNKGTHFTLKIPFEIPSPDLIKEINNRQKNTIIPPDWKQLQFLLIEDNTANILYAKDTFERWGLQMDIAISLEEANQKLAKSYDCILSDVKMPDGDGLEFITQLRKDEEAPNQNTPVIILTASTNENGADLAREVNIQSYLSKPFPPDQLAEELKKFLKIENVEPVNKPLVIKPKKEEITKAEKISQDFLDTLSKRFKGRTNLMVEMANIFMDQARELLTILEKAPSQGDWEMIRFESHKFKSTVNIIGLDELRAFAAKAEDGCNNGKPADGIQPILDDFKIQIESDIRKVKLAIDYLVLTEQIV